jgi:hypothetical protein
MVGSIGMRGHLISDRNWPDGLERKGSNSLTYYQKNVTLADWSCCGLQSHLRIGFDSPT